ncbi:MAG: hypothetical protein HOF21_14610 [Nitrospina sp.]|nr:hypothetical protein [Nitrospina sp.]
MTIDNYTKFIMTALTLALLLNGLNPWINPSQVFALENSAKIEEKANDNCSSNKKVTTQTLEGVNNVERVLGYIESSVNNIQLTISGINRKLNDMPSNSRKERN